MGFTQMGLADLGGIGKKWIKRGWLKMGKTG
jgi:hypothetical protein